MHGVGKNSVFLNEVTSFFSRMHSYYGPLLGIINNKSYAFDRSLSFPTTLSNLERWDPVYRGDMFYVLTYIFVQAERPAGEDRRVALSMSGSTRFRIPTLYCYLRCGDLRSPWVTERRSGHLEYATSDDGDGDDEGLCQKWRVKLIFEASTGSPEPAVVECLKIIDVGCKLK